MSYKVQKGDGWYKIAKRQGINVNDLLKANNATLDTMIHPGQMLKMPNQKTSQKNAINIPTDSYISRFTKNTTQSPNSNDSEEYYVYGYKTPQKANLVAKKGSLTDIQTKQAALVSAGYDLGKSGTNKDGIDGNWGKKSEAAWKQAMQDGYVYENGRLSKPKSEPKLKEKTKSSSTAGIQYAVHPMFGFSTVVDPKESVEIVKDVKKAITPRQYTAAQNTVFDAIKAPIKRGIASVTSPDVANFIMPTREFDESHLSNELYTWLQDAIDKKWDPEERKIYFEQNPDGEVNKGWLGRIVGTKHSQSDYQKYYNTPYEGPVTKGFSETMFGEGINQAQGTLGSFNIIYTKDGAYIVDDWDFAGNKKFDTSTPMGVVRQFAEDNGSHENDAVEPVRRIKAKIKYR